MKELIFSQNEKIDQLNKENTELRSSNKQLEKDILQLQETSLRLKVDISGIPESSYETYDQLRRKIGEIMMSICKGNTEKEKWDTSINIPIMDCERLGTYTQYKKRIVRVTFLFMKHKSCLLSRRSNLPRGIYVEEAYTDVIKYRRSILRPILKLALKHDDYKGKCKLVQDQLILHGTKYNIKTLDKLPEILAPYKAAQHTTTECLVFHGQHTPLSNFHPSTFNIEKHKFNSAEHYIQYKKAIHFNDHKTATKILQCKHAHEAKTLSHNIENYNAESWKKNCQGDLYTRNQGKVCTKPITTRIPPHNKTS